MGKIQLTRVDDRLIHGQVMTKWSKGLGINSIFIVDNEVAKDDFMKQIYISSGSRSGLIIKVFSTSELNQYYIDTKFEDLKVFLLFKSIRIVQEAVNKGVPIDVLNIGGISKKKDSKTIISSVSITDEELGILDHLNRINHVDVFFQTIPDSNKVSLIDWMRKQK